MWTHVKEEHYERSKAAQSLNPVKFLFHRRNFEIDGVAP